MFLLDGSVVTSASDLKKASDCEFAFLRELDVKLGRDTLFEPVGDAMLERAGALGTEHELRVLARYRERFGDGVVEIEQPSVRDAEAVAAAVDRTRDALLAGSPVVYQATFATDGFIGFADFIVRRPDRRYRVQDSKLARHARVTALLQLAAYAEQLTRLGIPVDDTVELLLGDGTSSEHRLDDIMPVYRRRVARLRQIVDERLADTGPVAWGDPRYAHDGRCPTCELEVQAGRDVLLVGSLRVSQREALADAGITTIDALAASEGPVPHLIDSTLENLRAQARLQLVAEARELEAVAAGTRPEGSPPLPPPVEVRDAESLAAIPAPSPGDLFFDFEGDPLYTEGDATSWNLDYLWGMVDTDDQYTALWAHSFAEERAALLRFLDLVKLRRQAHPDLHIYHYASYERTHLTAIAARHGVGEADVDQLLADGVLVDLYPIVKRGVRVGSRSYSIKKLEPLYMGDELREAEVKSGADSITEYVRARQLAESGSPAERDEARRILDDLADYNRYDCVSTRRLRDWLLAIARRAGVQPVPPAFLRERAATKVYEPSPLAVHLRELAGPAAPGDGRGPDETALALAAAAIDYHDREAKSFWWSHFLRTDQPADLWEDHRDVLIVDPGASGVVTSWHEEPRWGSPRRELLLTGRIAPGSRFSVGSGVFVFYEPDTPVPAFTMRPGQRRAIDATIVEVTDAGLVVEERGAAGETWSALPMAVGPGRPPSTDALRVAIAEWAAPIPTTFPALPANPAMDVLRRRPPRVAVAQAGSTPGANDYVARVLGAVQQLEHSYLAVQGPPGTGKTYVASHVIARLVAEHGWRIGVVAQSHAVVEHVLDAVVRAGLDGALVGKAVKDPAEVGTRPFTALAKKDDLQRFTAERAGGYVVGGTAWDFCNIKRVPRGSLDLLVIDEAGQFSLASTIAVSVSARNLLLLGDPQQLPQVSQALHPEPVDTSALGWVADGHEVLPPEYGVFLAESRRMHEAVAAPVSQLAYEGELRSHAIAAARHLDGVAPGLHAIPVEHEGNATASPEEAAVVVDLVRSLIGRAWSEAETASELKRESSAGVSGPAEPSPAEPSAAEPSAAEPSAAEPNPAEPSAAEPSPAEPSAAEPSAGIVSCPPRPLEQGDLIVVTPYNAQLTTVREALDKAGYPDVPVGTVDKFQGQEAAVAIVSLAASSAAAAPRGIEFLLLKNRLNVAVSRAKWAAYVLYSPGLLDALPSRPDGVAQLSAFMRLVGADAPAPVPA